MVVVNEFAWRDSVRWCGEFASIQSHCLSRGGGVRDNSLPVSEAIGFVSPFFLILLTRPWP